MKAGTHLSDIQALELAEGHATDAARAHAETCPSCKARVEPLRDMLSDLRASEIPEPSPLFWGHLSARIGAAVETERAPVIARTWLLRWGWKPAVAVAAATACLVLALAVVDRGADRRDTGDRAAAGFLQPAPVLEPEAWPDDDREFDLVAAIVVRLAGDEPDGGAFEFFPGAVERAARQLTPDEQDALRRLLEDELAGNPS